MKKIIVLILICCLGKDLIGQPPIKRAGPANTVEDYNLWIIRSFRPPVFQDTTEANNAITLDSCGKLLFTYDGNKLWKRQCNPKVWVEIGSGGGGGSITDTIQKVMNYITIDSIGDFSTFAGYTNSVSVRDSLRGGVFNIYNGTDTADNYMVCEDALGRKWQRFVQDGVLNARWFKFKAFNVALTNAENDMSPYMRAMLDYVNSHRRFDKIYIPEDKRTPDLGYFFLTRVTLDAKVKIFGDGATNYPKTKLLAWVNTGLFFQPYLKADGDITNTQLENLNLSASTSTDSSIALVEVRAQTHWKNVKIEGTGTNGGNGLTIIATSTVGDSLGNADRSSFVNCSFNQSYNGTYIYGDDANKITFYDCEWVGNKRWGLWDNGFLGNTVYSPHFAYNGANGINSKSVCSYAGKYYVSLIDTGFSNLNRQPDISPTYWEEVPGLAATAWDAGFIYMSGGAYAVTDLNAWSKCYDIYSECNQPPSKLNTRSEMTAGDNCAGVLVSSGGVYKYILTSIETQTGSKEFPTTDAHLSIGAARPGGNTSGLFLEMSNGNPTSIHINALGTFASIKLNQSADGGVPALIGYGTGARYLGFYPGNTLVMQLQETLGMVPGAHNTFDIGTSGNAWKQFWAMHTQGAGTKAVRMNSATGQHFYIDTLIFSAGWGNLISGVYPNIIIGADSSLLATKLYVKHYADSLKWTVATLYNSDGSLPEDRTVNGGGYNLEINNVSTTQIISTTQSVLQGGSGATNAGATATPTTAKLYAQLPSGASEIRAYGDSILLMPALGVLVIDSLNQSVIASNKRMVWDSVAKRVATQTMAGIYTPTLTNVANVAASTAYSCQYSISGNVVTVSGEVDIDPTTTLTLTQLGISLPIASNLTATNELGGTSADDLGTAARVAGDATNNRAEIRMTPVDVTNRRFSFTFTYRIL